VNRLIAIHLGEDHLDISTIAHYAQLHALIFASFAYSIPSFQELHPTDRASLLERNPRLHLSYVLAQYLTARSGLKQLECLIGESSAFKAIISQGGLHAMPCSFFAKDCASYEFHEVMGLVQTSSGIINRFNSKSLMALALLFYGDGLHLQNRSKVLHWHNYYLEVINLHLCKADPEIDLRGITSAIVPLANELNKVCSTVHVKISCLTFVVW
jgi:hypothetical protein